MDGKKDGHLRHSSFSQLPEIILVSGSYINQWNSIDNFRFITLLNTLLKVLVKVLTKPLAHVVNRLLGEAKTCVVSGRPIHDNLYFIRYILKKVVKLTCKGEVLLHLNQAKAIDMGDCWYLLTVLVEFRLSPVFRWWIIALYSFIESIVRVNGFLSKPFNIKLSVCQRWRMSHHLVSYVLALESLLRKLEGPGGVLCDLGYRRAVTANTNDITNCFLFTFELNNDFRNMGRPGEAIQYLPKAS